MNSGSCAYRYTLAVCLLLSRYHRNVNCKNEKLKTFHWKGFAVTDHDQTVKTAKAFYSKQNGIYSKCFYTANISCSTVCM